MQPHLDDEAWKECQLPAKTLQSEKRSKYHLSSKYIMIKDIETIMTKIIFLLFYFNEKYIASYTTSTK